ncbi:Predicted neuraminidase (sialidase) [Flavobacterium glycines]|uniref:Glycosyl hydrolase n=1 Tax=Flavobacterium glycines TaxID=551990 RepID=A0A1B9DZB5_9FLAO|nr:sialidase family protein [Flavobacterium glycines]OCB75007.1 glycosyl hydrolase [Flavobacterium glycines]GEL11301.1 hypothetical protein FGL01_20400 [Flavobacterium glycines]SDJ42670.1 Predicted neuraminidase (sialidase) [Flavobacterium glycines]
MNSKLIKYGIGFTIVFLTYSCKSLPVKSEAKHITTSYIANPPVTTNSHAATLVEYLPNEIMASWFGGSYEGAKDVGIYTSKLKEGIWTSPQLVVKPAIIKGDTLPCWNPVLFKSKKTKKLYLFYKVGKNPREWLGAMITSVDNGSTWTATKYLPDGFLGPIRNKAIQVSPGIILCGSSTESVSSNEWRAHVEMYNESTDSWSKITIPNDKRYDIIQPTILVHSNKSLQLFFRSKHNKLITSWSYDYGKTWTNAEMTEVVNSNSGIDALQITNQSFLLVNNPLPQGKDWFYGRNVLDVEYSNDGIKWKKLFDLENQKEGEFSYPAIIQTMNGQIHVVYTYNRKYIKYVNFEIKK